MGKESVNYVLFCSYVEPFRFFYIICNIRYVTGGQVTDKIVYWDLCNSLNS